MQNNHNVGDLLLKYILGKPILGIITGIIDNHHDPFNLFLYKVDWNDGEWWKYTKNDIMTFKVILERAKNEQINT